MLCSLALLMSSSKVVAMEKLDYETQKVLVLVAPWADRRALAVQYMDDAKKSNSVKEVEEVINEVKIRTIFNPKTDVVSFRVGTLHDSMSYNLFIECIDSMKPKEPKSMPALAPQKSSTSSCGLQ